MVYFGKKKNNNCDLSNVNQEISTIKSNISNETERVNEELSNKANVFNVVVNQEFLTGKKFNGKDIKGFYIPLTNYATNRNNTLISGVEILWEGKIWRKRNDGMLFSLPPNANSANQLLLSDNQIRLWILDYNEIGGTFTNECIVYVEYVKING